MERKINQKHLLLLTLLVSLVLLQTSAPGTELVPLDNQEADGYLQWLHSLEQAVKAREKAGAREGSHLFPFDQPGWENQEPRPYRHLAISKAIMELEAQWQLRGESRESSALVALAHARNYNNLSEFDSAMVWYQAAAKLDTLRLFHREIGREQFAATTVAGDSLAIIQLVTNTIGAADLTGRDRELVLVYRWLLTQRDSKTLELLLTKVEAQPEIMTDQMLFWHAYSQAWLEMKAASLVNLRELVKSGGLSKDLNESQRTWVLLAIPDLMFLMGAADHSRVLYETLTESNISILQTWSRYQVANLDFLEARYAKAASGFDDVCEAREAGSWQAQACEMANMARELERIRTEGEPYGAAQFYNP